jgi:hypothetical protein
LKRAAGLVADGLHFRSIAYRGDAGALAAYAWSDSAPWVALRGLACACFRLAGFGDAPWQVAPKSPVTPLGPWFAWVDVGCVAFFAADAVVRAAFTLGLPWGLQARLEALLGPSRHPSSPAAQQQPAGTSTREPLVATKPKSHGAARGRWDRALAAAAKHPFHDSPASARLLLVACLACLVDLGTRRWTGRQWSGLLRPACLFYYSEAVRIATSNTVATVPRVASVVLLEW